jgi:hypothetical protein
MANLNARNYIKGDTRITDVFGSTQRNSTVRNGSTLVLGPMFAPNSVGGATLEVGCLHSVIVPLDHLTLLVQPDSQ